MRAVEWSGVVFFIGVLFIVVANSLGFFTFKLCWDDSAAIVACVGEVQSKELGFFAALNWSFGLIFLFPMFVYFAIRSIVQARQAIDRGINRRMLLDQNWEPLSRAEVEKVVKKRFRLLWIASALVGAIAAFFIVGDFNSTVSVFYNDPAKLAPIKFPNPAAAIDWTLADAVCRYLSVGTCLPNILGRSANEIFAAVGYFYLPGVGSVLATGYMIGFGLFATMFGSAEFRSKGYLLVPDVRSTDPRGGFEVFESFFQHATIACLSLFAMGYLVSLQNVYFQTSDPSILRLIVPQDLTKLFEAIPQLPNHINPRIAAVSILGLFFIFIVFVAAVSALRAAVDEGRAKLLEAIDEKSEGRDDVLAKLEIQDVAALRERLEKVTGWPLNWPSVTTLIAWLVLATISMLVVSAGLYIIAAAIAYALSVAGIKKWMGGKGDTT